MNEDGGQAFPSSSVVHNRAGYDEHVMRDGMSLRDYFAGQALAGYRHAEFRWYAEHGSGDKFSSSENLARWAYADADAMLAERAKHA